MSFKKAAKLATLALICTSLLAGCGRNNEEIRQIQLPINLENQTKEEEAQKYFQQYKEQIVEVEKKFNEYLKPIDTESVGTLSTYEQNELCSMIDKARISLYIAKTISENELTKIGDSTTVVNDMLFSENAPFKVISNEKEPNYITDLYSLMKSSLRWHPFGGTNKDFEKVLKNNYGLTVIVRVMT